jgi:hypothetical protein
LAKSRGRKGVVLGEVKREERGCARRSKEGGKGLCLAKSRGRKGVVLGEVKREERGCARRSQEGGKGLKQYGQVSVFGQLTFDS